jgi:DNA (cytosine-5)-methyltransferase 1
MKSSLKYIDLFSGCGGLSLGLEKAGFQLELAVEKSPMASETFYHNFIEPIENDANWRKFLDKSIEEQALYGLVVNELRAVLDNDNIMNSLLKKDIDLVAGGPPCQGFSMAGRRNPKDARNQLPWQFMEFIERVSPKMVIMENVVGISRNFSKHNEEAPFTQLRRALEATGSGYVVQPVELNAMHYGVPEHRPRMMLLGVRKDIVKNFNIYIVPEIWKSEYDFIPSKNFKNRPSLVPEAKYYGKNIRTSYEALWDLDNNGYKVNYKDPKYNTKEGSYAYSLRNEASLIDGQINESNKNQTINNHTLRKHADMIIKRFRLYQYLQANGIQTKVLNIPLINNLTIDEKNELLKKALKDATFPAMSPDGIELASSEKELIDLITLLATRKHSQRPLNLSKPSPTVLTLPDDLIHPVYPRIMTVRELARIQSFPDHFTFRSKETTGSERRKFEVPQYTQVGNAVAPILAFELGKKFLELLKEYK